MASEERLYLSESVRSELDQMTVSQQERPPKPPTEEVGREIAGQCTRPHDHDQQHEVGVSLTRGDATDHDRQLTGWDQADPGAGLE